MNKVCVFTSTRADFGILTPLLKRLLSEPVFELRLFVTGTHLSKGHGLTVDEIKAQQIPIFYQVPVIMEDSVDIFHLGIMAEALSSFAKVLAADKPDFAILLGDRFEALAFAVACNGLGIPIVHLHGGEVTEGALDEAYRHCISKLSYIHFVATERYRERVISLGEAPDRVFNVGALGVDNIKNVQLLSKKEMEAILGIDLRSEVIAITYHPETLNPEKDHAQVKALLTALESRIEAGITSVVFTRANADHGNEAIHKEIEEFVKVHSRTTAYVYSLGMKRYLSLLKIASVVAGNSSSGIIEAPAIGTPTVNIGDRQKGREMAKSIFNVAGTVDEISDAINAAVRFKETHGACSFSLYGIGNAAEQMVEILKSTKFTIFPKKMFYDRK
ncbi:UDP-N-acetylglucosamine 2-epimerase [Bdellovibrio sp. 22V]|uniref:UDP-N-acetylglucosamine 2-epimerase n=1 Tax=Bdellovibrio sp. 22V TaxID=3044166 RepID=UPI002542A985|nr:UDP-N-acetylglucosamine 2-epimerase [Bdellovibrio sp. 22V]WII71827.1 UDP-N-acetylglucosamine 2-epimerase [Bdellovibrio sp. 22V]